MKNLKCRFRYNEMANPLLSIVVSLAFMHSGIVYAQDASANLPSITPEVFDKTVHWTVAENDMGATYYEHSNYATAEEACQVGVANTTRRFAEVWPDSPISPYSGVKSIAWTDFWSIGAPDPGGWARKCIGGESNYAVPICAGIAVPDAAHIGAVCIREDEPGECAECEEGATPVATGPMPAVGNPISIQNGTKVQNELDYSSADELLTVSRSYRSSPRVQKRARYDYQMQIFGQLWQGIIPGILVASGANMEFLDYLSANGITTRFRCLVPAFDGALSMQEWRDALWDRFYTGAPARQRRSVERYNIVKRA